MDVCCTVRCFLRTETGHRHRVAIAALSFDESCAFATARTILPPEAEPNVDLSGIFGRSQRDARRIHGSPCLSELVVR